MTEAERRAALEQIAEEIRGCTRCQLHRGRTHAVPGEGSPSTEVVFIGEGPGLNEDRQGRPFVGQAGSLLTELIGSIGWRREDVFITNIVKCRPPGNRDPEPAEIAACAPFLERQLEVLEPALVVTLGRHSMGRFMPGARIGQAHGTVRPADPDVGPAGASVFAMYHPAAALHQQSLRDTLFDDMRGVPTALLEARAARETRAAREADAAPVAVAGAADLRAIADAASSPAGELSAPARPALVPPNEPPAAEPGSVVSPNEPPAAEPPVAVSPAAEPPGYEPGSVQATDPTIDAPPTTGEPRARPDAAAEADQLTFF